MYARSCIRNWEIAAGAGRPRPPGPLTATTPPAAAPATPLKLGGGRAAAGGEAGVTTGREGGVCEAAGIPAAGSRRGTEGPEDGCRADGGS